MINMTHRARPAAAHKLLLLLALALLAACGSTKRFRKAQDAFNQAAAVDNVATLRTEAAYEVVPDEPLGGGIVDYGGSKQLYEQALELITEALDKDGKDLTRDGLEVQALTLKALCEWRLENWAAADRTAKAALTKVDAADRTRDALVLRAMPGLIRNDQAFALIAGWGEGSADGDEFKTVTGLLWGTTGSAYQILDHVRQQAAGHPVELYLVLAQLSALKNLLDAYVPFPDEELPAEFPSEADERLADLARLLPGAAADTEPRLLTEWSDALGRSIH